MNALLLAALLAACSPEVVELTDGSECTVDDAQFESLSTQSTDMATVLDAAFKTKSAGAAGVMYEVTKSGTVRMTPIDSGGTSHDAVIFGVPEDSDIVVRAYQKDENDELICSDPIDASTGSFPHAPLEYTTTVFDESAVADGYTLVSAFDNAGTSYVDVIDRSGELVWSKEMEGSIFQSQFALDGSGIRTFQPTSSITGTGYIQEIGFDGTEGQTYEVPAAHTSFTQHPHGGYLSLGWKEAMTDANGDLYALDTLLYTDLDGSTREIWDISQAIRQEQWDCDMTFGNEGFCDIGHSNFVSHYENPDTGEQAAMVSIRHKHTVAKVNLPDELSGTQAMGTLAWDVGGQTSSIA
ncbi:MAG: aryl-sulfate sulfotransferase, partial [Bdellovibrionota bacterium]